jgi:uncharacterized membrane protein
MRRWFVVENIFTLGVIVAITIFAPGPWKVMALVCFLNLNNHKEMD